MAQWFKKSGAQSKDSKDLHTKTINQEEQKVDGKEERRLERIEKIPVAIRVTPILSQEFCERFTYYGLSNNLVNYYTDVLNKTNANATSLNQAWSGVCYVTPLIGCAFADDFLGRYYTIVVGLVIYIIGMLLLVFSSFPQFVPAPGVEGVGKTFGFFYFSLMVVALGTGFIKPVVSTFGADQLKTQGGKTSFFNWYYWAINLGSLLSTLVVSLQEKNWTYGFMVPLITLVLSLIFFVAGSPMYKTRPTAEWPMKRFCKVVHKAIWNRVFYKKVISRPEPASQPIKASDNLKEGQQVDQKKRKFNFKTVECDWLNWALEADTPKGKMNGYDAVMISEVKLVMRLVPFLCTFILYWMVYSQMNNLFVLQGDEMYQPPIGPVLGKLAAAQMSFFDTLAIIIGVPLYDKVIAPGFKRMGKPIGMKMRIFLGNIVAIFAMVYPAIIEVYRRRWAVQSGYQMHILLQIPSYVLVGISEVLASIGQIDFAYDQAPASMRSTISALQLLCTGIGTFLSSALTKVIQTTTSRRGRRPGWIPDEDLNEGHIEYFFTVVAILMFLSTVVYAYIALTYKDKKEEVKLLEQAIKERGLGSQKSDNSLDKEKAAQIGQKTLEE